MVKSRKFNKTVIPAKAGIQEFQIVIKRWTPVFTGVTAFYGIIKNGRIRFFCVLKIFGRAVEKVERHKEILLLKSFPLMPKQSLPWRAIMKPLDQKIYTTHFSPPP